MKIYLAGNIEGVSKNTALNWRNKIRKHFNKNYKFLCPKITPDLFESYNFDRALINKSDIILAKINETPSWGTAMEIFYANSLNKVVICFTLEKIEIHGWIQYNCVKSLNVNNLKEVADYIKSLNKYGIET